LKEEILLTESLELGSVSVKFRSILSEAERAVPEAK